MTAGEFGRTVRVLLAWFCAPPCEKCRNYRGRSTERLHWRISSTSHYVYIEYSLAYDTWWYLNKNVFAITYRISSGERGEENGPSVYTDMFTIRYFRVTCCLCVKMSLHAKPFIWKCVQPTGSFSWKLNSLSYERFCLKTRLNQRNNRR